MMLSVIALAQTNPLQQTDLGITGQNYNWNYNMGYRFTANSDGDVTHLGGRWADGVVHTVRLYSYPAGTVLASASVTGSTSWSYVELGAPVTLTSGNSYVVAVRLDSQSSGMYTTFNTPVTEGGIEILGSTYASATDNMPTNLQTTNMYGQADITFEPCTYAGTLSADDVELISGESTTITVSNNVGNIQWQSSEDNSSWADITGETGATLNTGGLDTTTYYRTYITSGACGSDTSSAITISVIDPFNPLKALNPGTAGTDMNWNYNMGYRFSPTQDGDVSQLGGRWTSGVTHTVRLYEYPAGTVLATASVTGTGDFNYEDITPVAISAASTYVVAVRLDGQSSGYYTQMGTPETSAGIEILNATYVSASDAMPTNSVTTYMYGQADLRFDPCSFAGLLVAEDEAVQRYDSTTLTCVDPIGSIQWQFSTDNESWTNMSGETDSVLNTGVLNTTSYYRTYVTDGLCSPPDTSNVVTIRVTDPTRPLQYTGIGTTTVNNNWDYNMGYKFTADVNGNITELGGRWKTGVDHTVRLYRVSDQAVLASATVTGNEEWAYNTITPVAITAGTEYFVAVRLDGQASGYSTTMAMPVTSAQINIQNAGYVSASDNMPTNSVTTTMYGQADFKFEPCVYAGTTDLTDATVCPGGSTTIEVNEYSGSIQWQSSTDNITFSDVTGETDSILNTGALAVTTYFRVMASDGCGSDSTVADSVMIVGAGGTAGLWTALTDTDWNNACNWDDGVVPTTGDAVEIPSGIAVPSSIPEISLSYLKIDNNSGVTLSGNLTITDSLWLKAGNIDLGTDSLFLDDDAYFVGGYSTSYVDADGGGAVVKSYSVADGSTFTFPVGDGNDFCPIDFDLNVGSVFGASAAVAISVSDIKQPQIGSPEDYITRYWTIDGVDFTTVVYDVNATYTAGDIVGTESNLIGMYYQGGSWTNADAANVANNTVGATAALAFGDFSAAVEPPYISTGDGDWDLLSTWDQGILPGSASSVVILDGHTVTMTGDETVASIDVNDGGILAFDGNTLNITENLVMDGDHDSNGTFNFNGTNPQTITTNDTARIHNMIVDNLAGVTSSGGVHWLTGNLTLSNGTYTTGGVLTLVSDNNGTANVAEITSGAISGDVNIQRYIAGPDAGWVMMGASGTGMDIAAFSENFVTTGFTGSNYPSYGFNNIYYYDETSLGAQSSGWVGASDAADAVTPGTGYFIYFGDGSWTVEYTAPIQTGPVDLGVTYTDDPAQPATEDGWQAVANPYPCTIDWDDADWTKVNVNDAIYIWDEQNQNYASYIASVGTNGGSQYIAPGQAFYIQTYASSPSLTVDEDVKAPVAATFFKTAVKQDPQVKLTIQDEAGYYDETVFRLSEKATYKYDESVDARKFFSDNLSIPQIYSLTDDVKYSINSIGEFDATENHDLYIKVASAGTYTLEVELVEFPIGGCARLTDNLTGDVISLENGMTHFFSIYGAVDEARFTLNLGAPAELSTQAPLCSGVSNGQAIAVGSGSGMWQYDWYDADGLIASNTSATHDTLSDLGEGVYTVIVTGDFTCQTDTLVANIESTDQLQGGFVADKEQLMRYETVRFTATTNADEVQWNFGNGLTAVGENAVTYYQEEGVFVVTMTAISSGCTVVSEQEITVSENLITSSGNLSEGTFVNAYVTSGQMIVELASPSQGTATIEITDALGRQVQTTSTAKASEAAQWNLPISLTSGVYVLNITIGDERYTRKLSVR